MSAAGKKNAGTTRVGMKTYSLEGSGASAWLAGLLGPGADAIIAVDEGGRIVFYNRAAERIFGHLAVEMLGQPVDRLLPEPHAPTPAAQLRRFRPVDTSSPHAASAGHGLRRNGEEFPLHASIAQLQAPEGTLHMIVLRDMTGRVEDAQEQARLGARLSALLDGATDGIIMTDASRRIILCNRAAERMFGWSAAQLAGRPAESVMPQLFAGSHHEQPGGHAGPGPMSVRVLMGLRATGEEIPIEASISPMDSPEGTLFTAFVRALPEQAHAKGERSGVGASDAVRGELGEMSARLRNAATGDSATQPPPLSDDSEPVATIEELARPVQLSLLQSRGGGTPGAAVPRVQAEAVIHDVREVSTEAACLRGGAERTSVSTQGFRCSGCQLHDLWFPGVSTATEPCHLVGMGFSRRRLREGQALYREGDVFKFIYAVRSGTFKSTLMLLDGREQVTGFQMAGELLGLDGVASGGQASSAVALEDAEVCSIPYARLVEIASSNVEMQLVLARLMSAEIVREHKLMAMLGTMSADERVASFLLDISRRLQARGYSPQEFHLRMTRADIGSYLGVKLETVSRSLSAFAAQGLLVVDKKHLRIVDFDGLQRMISMDLQ